MSNDAVMLITLWHESPIRYIYLTDLMRFMGRDEAIKALQVFGAGSEGEGINKASLTNWLVMGVEFLLLLHLLFFFLIFS